MGALIRIAKVRCLGPGIRGRHVPAVRAESGRERFAVAYGSSMTFASVRTESPHPDLTLNSFSPRVEGRVGAVGASRTRTLGDQRGAAMVFGIFFAVFLLASVYRLHGLAEAVLYRQQLQDAADASAFSAAVVNARGMNLIALINMAMAAVLSVLVGLRVAQTLVLVGIGLCGLLAWPTSGVSLNAINPLRAVNKQIDTWADRVENRMPQILGLLHKAGKAVSVVVPIGSNARVLELAMKQYDQRLGVAIPARVTLPVEDGKFEDLCAHAGELAGRIAMFPLSPLLPNLVIEGLTEATKKLAAAGPRWFCGGADAGSPPDLDEDRDYDPRTLPVLPKQRECAHLLDKYDDPTAEQSAHINAVCEEAGIEYLASMPGQNGKAREGEPLCPSDCHVRPRPSCPPPGVESCTPEQSAEIEAQARAHGRPSIVPGGPNSPYALRTVAAREQCDPGLQRQHPIGGVWWLQQSVTHVYEWVELGGPESASSGQQAPLGTWRLSVSEESEPALVRNNDEVRTRPCGKDGKISEIYSREPGTPVCESEPRCVDARGTPIADGPCDRTPPKAGGAMYLRERVERVTELLRCVELAPHTKVKTPPLDLKQSLASKNTDGTNTSPFQLEEGVWLGGSDFQLRALVIGNEPPSTGRSIVPLALWSEERGEGYTEYKVAQTARLLGQIGLAQAEYYFDLGKFRNYADQQNPKHVVEWLWHQGWVARMRPFRLSMSKADGPKKREGGLDDEQRLYATEGDEPQGLSRCTGLKACEKVGGLLDAFGVGEGS